LRLMEILCGLTAWLTSSHGDAGTSIIEHSIMSNHHEILSHH
jgi:hypothetical protein